MFNVIVMEVDLPEIIKDYIDGMNEDGKDKEDQFFLQDLGELSFKITEFTDKGKLTVNFSHILRKITEVDIKAVLRPFFSKISVFQV